MNVHFSNFDSVSYVKNGITFGNTSTYAHVDATVVAFVVCDYMLCVERSLATNDIM